MTKNQKNTNTASNHVSKPSALKVKTSVKAGPRGRGINSIGGLLGRLGAISTVGKDPERR